MAKSNNKRRPRRSPAGIRWKDEEAREINEAADIAAPLKPVDIVRIGAINLARIIKRTRSVPIEPPQ